MRVKISGPSIAGELEATGRTYIEETYAYHDPSVKPYGPGMNLSGDLNIHGVAYHVSATAYRYKGKWWRKVESRKVPIDGVAEAWGEEGADCYTSRKDGHASTDLARRKWRQAAEAWLAAFGDSPELLAEVQAGEVKALEEFSARQRAKAAEYVAAAEWCDSKRKALESGVLTPA